MSPGATCRLTHEQRLRVHCLGKSNHQGRRGVAGVCGGGVARGAGQGRLPGEVI